MLKLIIGLKGSGKTKTLISLANEAGEKSSGSVVCIEKGTKLIHEIKYLVRLMDSNAFSISNAEELYGFLCGVFASNNDITDLFVDSALKICDCTLDVFASFIEKVAAFAEKANINVVITSSIAPADLPENLNKYL